MSEAGGNQAVVTMRWRDKRLEMIDQRVLPAKFEYLAYDSAASVAEGIRSMVVRGAPAIGCAAAYGVALEALALANAGDAAFAAGMEQAFDILAASRPTAVNLFWALKRMRAVLLRHRQERVAAADLAGLLLAEAHEVLAEDIRINRSMGASARRCLPMARECSRIATPGRWRPPGTAPRSASSVRQWRPASASRSSLTRRARSCRARG